MYLVPHISAPLCLSSLQQEEFSLLRRRLENLEMTQQQQLEELGCVQKDRELSSQHDL